MLLSESYKNRIKNLAGIVSESKSNKEESETKWEYQLRDIGGSVFYKRKKGDDNWMFTSADEFAEGLANGGKLIKWKKSEK